MIEGSVNAYAEPTLDLTVYGPEGEAVRLEFLVDTGFTGALTLHSSVVAALGLRPTAGSAAVLADGSEIFVELCEGAALDWAGARREVTVAIADTVSLLGMRALEGHELLIRAVPGGIVQITPL